MQQAWEDYYKAHDYFHLEPHEALEGFSQMLSDYHVSKVLDLGCGAGSDMLYLAEQGFAMEGVDFSPAAAANAEDLLQSKGLTGKVYVDNLFDKVTTFKPEEFRGLIAINSLEYTDLDTFKPTIYEIARILGTHGLFLLVVPSQESTLESPVKEKLYFSEDEIMDILKRNFSILDYSHDKDHNHVIITEKNSH